MEKGEYFKIETEEELIAAYEMFRSQWLNSWTLQEELLLFRNDQNARLICKDSNWITLRTKNCNNPKIEIESPLKKQFKLPEKWCLKVTEENYKVLDEYFKRSYSFRGKHAIAVINGEFKKYKEIKQDLNNYEWYQYGVLPEITFEQFKQHVMKEKEIIGYKLEKEHYREAAIKIVGSSNYLEGRYGEHINITSLNVDKLKEAGVLDLWFTPIYKKVNKLPKIGCQEGIYSKKDIIYGDKTLPKKCLKQMEKAGITSIIIQHGKEEFNVYGEELQQIYKIANAK